MLLLEAIKNSVSFESLTFPNKNQIKNQTKSQPHLVHVYYAKT